MAIELGKIVNDYESVCDEISTMLAHVTEMQTELDIDLTDFKSSHNITKSVSALTANLSSLEIDCTLIEEQACRLQKQIQGIFAQVEKVQEYFNSGHVVCDVCYKND